MLIESWSLLSQWHNYKEIVINKYSTTYINNDLYDIRIDNQSNIVKCQYHMRFSTFVAGINSARLSRDNHRTMCLISYSCGGYNEHLCRLTSYDNNRSSYIISYRLHSYGWLEAWGKCQIVKPSSASADLRFMLDYQS